MYWLMLTWRISHLLALQKKVCSKLTKQIRHGKKHAAFVFITHVPHEIGKCVRYVSVHGSKWASERESECQCERDERICESAVEPMPHKLIQYNGCVKWITTTPYSSVDSFIQPNAIAMPHSIRLNSFGLRCGSHSLSFSASQFCIVRVQKWLKTTC